MTTKQFRAITVNSNVKLPAVSTEVPDREYTFMAFIREYMLESPSLRTDENLPYYFEWADDVVPKFLQDTDKQVKPLEIFTREAFMQREDDLNNFRIGKTFYISDESFHAGVSAAKKSLDEALEKKQVNGQMISPMPVVYAPKVLRHYFSLKQSKIVEQKDIPNTSITSGTSPEACK
jgi:hypothetical protein